MNRLITYIGKALKAGVVATAAVAFVGGSLLCCCLTKTAQAAVPQKSCCHKNQTAKADPPKTCEHCKLKSSFSDLKVFDFVPSLAKDLHAFFVVDAVAYRMQTHLPQLVYTGPPRAPSSPIYLQVSCLRL